MTIGDPDLAQQRRSLQDYVASFDPQARRRWMKVHSALARGDGRRIVRADEIRVGNIIDVLMPVATTRVVEHVGTINGGMIEIVAGGSYRFKALPSDDMVLVDHAQEAKTLDPELCYDLMAETPKCTREFGHDWKRIQEGEGGYQCLDCGAWYDWTQDSYVAVLVEMKQEVCPHPIDKRYVSTIREDIYPRRACLECGAWLDPVVCRPRG